MKTLLTIPLVALLAGCGLSTGETAETSNDGTQSELSSASATSTTPCAKGQAYCAATNSCYPEACLSCCMFPTCGKGESFCPATGRCYPSACLSCCMINPNGDPNTDPAPQPGSVDPNTDPAPQTDPPECDPRLCGPAPGMPTYQCADGTLGGFTGRCLPHGDGTCGWEIRSCPTDDRAP